MSFPLSIVIWDYDPERIAEIDRNLHLALRELNLRVLRRRSFTVRHGLTNASSGARCPACPNRRSCPAKGWSAGNPSLKSEMPIGPYGREKPSPKKPASSCFHESSKKRAEALTV
jgi:hypothetical protein